MIEQSRRTGPFGQSSGFNMYRVWHFILRRPHFNSDCKKMGEKRKDPRKKTSIHCPTRISSGFCPEGERGHFDAKPAFTKIRFQIYGNFRKCWKRLAFSLEACYDAQKEKGPRMRIDENATKAGTHFYCRGIEKGFRIAESQIWPGIEAAKSVVLPSGSSAANQDSDLFVGKGI